jgi:aliphatic nitrilase
MSSNLPRFRAAACHASSVFLDAPKSAEKACDLIAEAARNGASLVAFPEGFIPGFPIWAALQAPIMSHDLFKALAAQALRLDGPELANIRMAAKRHGMVVSIGFTEGTVASLGCLWNSNLLIGEDGAILNHHRKLVPTFYEKLIWARRARIAGRGDRGGPRWHVDLRGEHEPACPLRLDGARRAGSRLDLSSDLADQAFGRKRRI